MSGALASIAIETSTPPAGDPSLDAWKDWSAAYAEWTMALRLVNDFQSSMFAARANGMDEAAARLLYSADALEQRERMAAERLALAQDLAVSTVPRTLASALAMAEALETGQVDDDDVPVALASLASGLRGMAGL